MAEIRSTLDLVLERAARMGTADAGEMRADELNRRGMRLGAEFLDSAEGKPDALAKRLKDAPEAEGRELRRGMLSTMLRNLFLPRDEAGRERMKRAMAAISALNGGGQARALCRELESIATRYGEHRKQIQDQLKEQLRMQLQQALVRETGVKADAARIDPTLDPRYAQEWARIEAELNAQYGQALDQYRAELARLSGV